ncbi:MAG: hypothetical protein ACRCWR_04910 [Saezia sp.]
MLLFRFITGHPWIFAVFGCMMLALVGYSIFDVQRGGNILPFEQLQVYSGKVVEVKKLGESEMKDPDGKIVPIYFEEIKVLLPTGEERNCRLLLKELLPLGTHVTVHEGEKNKVYNLVADGRLLVDYQALSAHALKRAQEAKDALTRPIVLGFAGALILWGVFAQVRVNRKRRTYRQQQQVLY